MKTFLINFLLLVPIWTFCQDNTDNIKRKMIEYIKSDYVPLDTSNTKPFVFIDSKTSIGFDLESLTEDVIAKDYIKGFRFYDSELNKRYKSLVSKVSDSLKNVSKYLNSICETKEEQIDKLFHDFRHIYVFFTDKCQKQIYVEVLASNSIVPNKSYDEYYGEAKTYLFFINEKSEIVKVYHGEVEYN
jgi:hypothetical protein